MQQIYKALVTWIPHLFMGASFGKLSNELLEPDVKRKDYKSLEDIASEYKEEVTAEDKIKAIPKWAANTVVANSRKIGYAMPIFPDIDILIQEAYLSVLRFRFPEAGIPGFSNALAVNSARLEELGIPEQYAAACDELFCHRTPITHSLAGVMLAGLIGGIMYYKSIPEETSLKDKLKYGTYGAFYYGAQVAVGHLFIDSLNSTGYLRGPALEQFSSFMINLLDNGPEFIANLDYRVLEYAIPAAVGAAYLGVKYLKDRKPAQTEASF